MECPDDPVAASPSRFRYLENMWRDYGGGSGCAIETFPGYRILCRFPACIYGIFSFRTDGQDLLIVHAGTSLYAVDAEEAHADTFSLPAPVPGGDGTLAEHRSQAFVCGQTLYLLDGERYLSLASSDGILTLSEVKDRYTPITYSDGTAYEGRNLLSDSFIQQEHPVCDGVAPYGTAELFYQRSQSDDTCSVYGIRSDFTGDSVYIPSEAMVAGRLCRVVSIFTHAFYRNKHIRFVHVAEGITRIWSGAFADCPYLEEVYLPDSLQNIGADVFADCPSLTLLSVGGGLEKVDTGVLGSGVPLRVHGPEGVYDGVEGIDPFFLNRQVTYSPDPAFFMMRYPLLEDCPTIVGVALDGTPVSDNDENPISYKAEYEGDLIRSLLLIVRGTHLSDGAALSIEGKYTDGTLSGRRDFLHVHPEYAMHPYAAVFSCTMCTLYDGRTHLAGNPALPNTVFYTCRDRDGRINPAYIGTYAYFEDGIGQNPVRALLSTTSALAVLKEDGEGEASIHLHHGQDSGDPLLPRIYPSTEYKSGRGCAGDAVVFAADPVFLAEDGVYAIEPTLLNGERRLAHRSFCADPRLRAHSPSEARCAVWEGYLVIAYPDGEVLLADSRRTFNHAGDRQYEWYRLSDVLAYRDDLPLTVYADAYPTENALTVVYEGVSQALCLHPKAGEIPLDATRERYAEVYPSIISGTATDGNDTYPVLFTKEDIDGTPKLYLLALTGERVGGTPYGIESLLSVGGALYFGFADGSLARVNTDRRGQPNAAQLTEMTEQEYKRLRGHIINREWYTYGGHRIRSGFITSLDDADIPHYTKDTVRKSTVAELKTELGGTASFQVCLSRGSYLEEGDPLHPSGERLDFSDLDYGRIAFATGEISILSLREHSRRWVRKQYRVYSDEFCRPFGFYRISYSYVINGKVKAT